MATFIGGTLSKNQRLLNVSFFSGNGIGIKTTKGGSCIVYTHFANDLCTNGKIDKEFSRLMKIKILPKREGWFIPVSILLDHLRTQLSCNMNIDSRRLRQLEWKWLASKFAYVTS